jgi:hypothetical protein
MLKRWRRMFVIMDAWAMTITIMMRAKMGRKIDDAVSVAEVI